MLESFMNCVTLPFCFHSFSLTMTKWNVHLPNFQMLAPVDLYTGAHHTLWTNRLIFKGFWNLYFFFILAKIILPFQNKKKLNKWKGKRRRKLQFHGATWTFAGSHFLPWCSTSPSPLNNSHWHQNQLLQKQGLWGLKRAGREKQRFTADASHLKACVQRVLPMLISIRDLVWLRK